MYNCRLEKLQLNWRKLLFGAKPTRSPILVTEVSGSKNKTTSARALDFLWRNIEEAESCRGGMPFRIR